MYRGIAYGVFISFNQDDLNNDTLENLHSKNHSNDETS